MNLQKFCSDFCKKYEQKKLHVFDKKWNSKTLVNLINYLGRILGICLVTKYIFDLL